MTYQITSNEIKNSKELREKLNTLIFFRVFYQNVKRDICIRVIDFWDYNGLKVKTDFGWMDAEYENLIIA